MTRTLARRLKRIEDDLAAEEDERDKLTIEVYSLADNMLLDTVVAEFLPDAPRSRYGRWRRPRRWPQMSADVPDFG